MKRIKLGVNIDHVATVRNARGDNYPDPLRAALLAQKSGADSITIHLREDRRHIIDKDLELIKSRLRIPLNLEIAATKEMLDIALKNIPDFICIVPEKREEITTEGGLNLNYKKIFLKKMILKLKENGSRVSLFIEPNLKDVEMAHYLNADCVELHTGRFCNLVNNKRNFKKELVKIKRSVILGNKIGLEVHAGHGLNYKTAKMLSKIDLIKEFNIGHFLIGESIFIGLPNCIKNFKSFKIMKIFGIGTDIANINRIKKSIKNKIFIKRLFNEKEIKKCQSQKNSANCFAKRFAAKEAFSKAIGTGISNGIRFNEIFVKNIKTGKPKIMLLGETKKVVSKILKKRKYNVFLSLSDDEPFAIATVVISV